MRDAGSGGVTLASIPQPRGEASRQQQMIAYLLSPPGRVDDHRVRAAEHIRPGRVIVLLDGVVKKRGDIPPRDLERMRRLRTEAVS